MPGKTNVQISNETVHVNFAAGTANLEAVNKFCFDNGIVLSHLQLKKKSLETKFLELTN
jgi:ABC-2 type transport system ATP-binding protein